MMSLSPNIYTSLQKYGKAIDFMLPCTLHIYTTYSIEWVGFFLFTTIYAIYISWKSRCNHRHLATLYRYIYFLVN